jgi:hypothetical protein
MDGTTVRKPRPLIFGGSETTQRVGERGVASVINEKEVNS